MGEEDALRIGIERADEQTRQTTLSEKLKNIKEETESIKQEDTEKENHSNMTYEEMMMAVDPMIGMEGVTPYQFM